MADNAQHFDRGDLLAVSVTQRIGDAGAGGGDRREFEALKDTGAGYVPGICKQQNIRAVVKRAEFVGFLFLRDGHCKVTREQRIVCALTMLG